MMDKLALEMETFEEILERFEVDVARAKECGDYSQMVSGSIVTSPIPYEYCRH